MKCRICGCVIPEGESHCTVCGVKLLQDESEQKTARASSPTKTANGSSTFCGASLEQDLQRAEFGSDESAVLPSARKKKKILAAVLGLILLLFVSLILIGVQAFRHVTPGEWRENRYSSKSSGLAITANNTYFRNPEIEQKQSTDSVSCEAVLASANSDTVLALNLVNLTADSPFGLFYSEKQYLNLVLERFSEKYSETELEALSYTEFCGKRWLQADCRITGTFGSSGSVSVYERFLLRKVGRSLIFINAVSFDSQELDLVLKAVSENEGG